MEKLENIVVYTLTLALYFLTVHEILTWAVTGVAVFLTGTKENGGLIADIISIMVIINYTKKYVTSRMDMEAEDS